MSKPIVITTAILVSQRGKANYALELLREQGEETETFRFELTPEAFEQLRYDTHEGLEDDKLFGAENKIKPGMYRL